jgi:tetratricopeptide (TPR) repeat protein
MSSLRKIPPGWLGDNDAAQAEAAKVGQINASDPNSAVGYWALAHVLNSLGKPAEAIVAVDKAMRLDPRNGELYIYEQGRAYSLLGRSEEAIPVLRRYLAYHPNFYANALLAVDYIELSDDHAARAEVAEVLKLDPQFSVETCFPTASVQNRALPQIERFRADLRKAGLK